MAKLTEFEAALLSEAAHILFESPNGNGVGLSGGALQDFITGLSSSGSSRHLAQTLARDWRVVAHQPNTDSGFSATLFQRVSDGEYVMAVRGTELTEAWGLDVRDADVGGIVNDGLAWAQAVDLYNFWQALTATGDTYQAIVTTPLNAYAGPALEASGAQNFIVDSSSPWFLTAPEVVRLDAVSQPRPTNLPRISPDAQVHAVGHSLGGHLATAFSRLFEDTTLSTVSINGAGHGNMGGTQRDNIERFYAALGGAATFNSDSLLSLHGEGGAEIIAMSSASFLQQPSGANDWPVFIAEAGHSSTLMTDSLAVNDLFARLNRDRPTQSQLVMSHLAQTAAGFQRRGSPDAQPMTAANTGSLRAIGALFGVVVSPIVGDRASFYTAYEAILASSSFRQFVGAQPDTPLLQIRAGADDRSAQTDFNAFLTLYFQLPFNVEPTSSDAAVSLR